MSVFTCRGEFVVRRGFVKREACGETGAGEARATRVARAFEPMIAKVRALSIKGVGRERARQDERGDSLDPSKGTRVLFQRVG